MHNGYSNKYIQKSFHDFKGKYKEAQKQSPLGSPNRKEAQTLSSHNQEGLIHVLHPKPALSTSQERHPLIPS